MSSHLYRSTGGAMRFYTQSGAGFNVKKALTHKVDVPVLKYLPVSAWIGILALVVLIIVLAALGAQGKLPHQKEGFGQFIPGGQTGSGFAGTFTQHRSQHSPRNRTVDDLQQLGEMGYDTGHVATGQPEETAESWSDLQDALGEEDFEVVGDEDVPDERSIIPIPSSGQANPEPFMAGRADFFDDIAANNTNWLEARLRKQRRRENFMGASKGRGRAPSAMPNESLMGFVHILPEDDYDTRGVSADEPEGQGAGFLNPRTMGQSHRPQSQRLVEGFDELAGGCPPGTEWDPMAGACVAEEFTAYDELSGDSFRDTPVECVGPGGQPLTALQRKVLGCPQQEGMSFPPTSYGYAIFPSSYQRRNMISGQPDRKARKVVHGHCSKQSKGQCKRSALCDWNANRKKCMPAKRPANECVFPLNPKYKPKDPKTGQKVLLPANACIDTSGSNFNKWVETDWVLKHDKPYAALKQSDMYYKQLQNVVYHNPKVWDVKKPHKTKTSIEPGAVQSYARKRRDPVGVDDSELIVDDIKAAKAVRKELVKESAKAAVAQRKKEGFLGWLLG